MAKSSLFIWLCLGLVQTSNSFAACRLWSQSRCDETNGASIELDTEVIGEFKAWTFGGSGRVWGFEPGLTTWTSPAIAVVDNIPTLYVGSYDHSLYALDAWSGKELWRFNTGASIHSAPVIMENNREFSIIVSSNDRSVYSLDAKYGRQRWAYTIQPFAPSIGGARVSSPCVAEIEKGRPIVFVSSWIWDRSLANSIQKSSIVALNGDTGKLIWDKAVSDGELTSAVFSVVKGKGLIFLGSNAGNIMGIEAKTGEIVWKRVELDAVRSPPAVIRTPSQVLVLTSSKNGLIRAVNAEDGSEKWAFQTGDRITGSPTVVNKTAVIGSYDRNLYVLDIFTGKQKKKIGLAAGIYSSISVIRGMAVALFMAWDDMLHVRNIDGPEVTIDSYVGKPLWNVAGMDDSNWSSPITAKISGRWLAFVGSYDGKLRGISLGQVDRTVSDKPSNFGFWLSFPLLLFAVGLGARLMTKRYYAKDAGLSHRQ